MKIFRTVLTAVLICAGVCQLAAGDLYVSAKGGKKKGPGTKEAPFKTISDAVKKANPGDVIHIAAGKYAGKLGASEIVIDKAVSLVGSYSPDFSQRDIAKFTTLIQPPNDKNDTKGLGLLTLKPPAGKGPDMLIDGLVIDQSYMNSYHTTKGKPEGVETGMWLQPPAKGANDKFGSAMSYSIYKETQNRYEGNITIQNCVISNSGQHGINISHYIGTVRVVNNVFVACRMMACLVTCSKNQPGAVQVEFANNTVLFSWSRTSEMTDMGYGFECSTNVTSNIHHNIFGLNVYAGVKNDKGDPKSKSVKLDNNIFFLNKIADVTAVKSPNQLKLRVDDEAFEDMSDFPGMASVESNVSLKDPALFKGRINQAYLTAFLSATYAEKTDYDPNSPANVFRSALGINQRGTIQTKVSMYCNRYPLNEVFALFGAVKGFGAQAPAK